MKSIAVFCASSLGVNKIPLRTMVAEGFTRPTFAATLAIEDDLEKLLDRFGKRTAGSSVSRTAITRVPCNARAVH